MLPAHSLSRAIDVLTPESFGELRPVQVLRKTRETDPMLAANAPGTAYLRDMLAKRVCLELFENDVIERAAVYSGGVLRTFLELFCNAALRAADLYEQQTVNASTFNDHIHEAKNALARSTYLADRAALTMIHQHHVLPDCDALRLIAASLVLEYGDDGGIWWEAHPLSWHLLR